MSPRDPGGNHCSACLITVQMDFPQTARTTRTVAAHRPAPCPGPAPRPRRKPPRSPEQRAVGLRLACPCWAAVSCLQLGVSEVARSPCGLCARQGDATRAPRLAPPEAAKRPTILVLGALSAGHTCRPSRSARCGSAETPLSPPAPGSASGHPKARAPSEPLKESAWSGNFHELQDQREEPGPAVQGV